MFFRATAGGLLAALVVFTLPVSSAAEEFSMVDAVRMAFFEHAPRSLTASMRKAVQEKCMAIASERKAAHEWLCAGEPLLFFRGVNVLGTKQDVGMVCAETAVTPTLKYYPPDIFDNASECFFVAYDVEARKHLVVAEDD